jgi:hypothetical protein
MFFKFSHFDTQKNFSVLKNIENSKYIYESETIFYKNKKKFSEGVKRIKHEDLLKIPLLVDTILSDKLIDYLINKFGKIYLICQFACAINGFNPTTHRDGQSMGYSKESFNACSKVFKVGHYFKFIENKPIISFGRFNSAPVNIFSNPILFKYINVFLEEKIKSKFLKTVEYNIGDALVFDQNTWHAAYRPKEYNGLNIGINKCMVDYEFSTDYDSAMKLLRAQTYSRPKNNSIEMLPEPTRSRLIQKSRIENRFKMIF